MGFFSRLVSGLTKTRESIISGFDYIFSGFSSIDDDFYEELEEVLIMADLGVNTTELIIEDLKNQVKEQHIKKPEACRQVLIDSIKRRMDVVEGAYDFENTVSVVLVIGVNGVGKTTTIGKLAAQYRSRGKKVILAAADTFRAAAIEQLTEWAHRANVDIISGQEGSDPAAVIFDAIAAAKARKADILLCDTAGRLHNKKNLMAELSKISRIIEREYPEAKRENLIVLDGTTGQNALVQAKQFKEAADITGIILTKLDGTAKGGIAIAIQSELGVPVKYIGIGEKINDLQKFDSGSFVDALFTPVGDEPKSYDDPDETVPEAEAAEESQAEEVPEAEAAEESQAEEVPEDEAAEESQTEEVSEVAQAEEVAETAPVEIMQAETEEALKAPVEEIQAGENVKSDSPSEEENAESEGTAREEENAQSDGTAQIEENAQAEDPARGEENAQAESPAQEEPKKKRRFPWFW